MKVKYSAKISWMVDKGHPDYSGIKNPEKPLEFSDDYVVNTECFNNEAEIAEYIENDMKLIAGGGYSTDHIHDVHCSVAQESNVCVFWK